ncbi:hypothetical protein [uncultured Clostridium sp.]|uniref:hypothetical protein n=1 Tax=uncultured Clostridium sp. TaxID=59620 RepID=UPI0025F897A3|nr:hypothetical protein [uncultured Clostridium sp.]
MGEIKDNNVDPEKNINDAEFKEIKEETVKETDESSEISADKDNCNSDLDNNTNEIADSEKCEEISCSEDNKEVGSEDLKEESDEQNSEYNSIVNIVENEGENNIKSGEISSETEQEICDLKNDQSIDDSDQPNDEIESLDDKKELDSYEKDMDNADLEKFDMNQYLEQIEDDVIDYRTKVLGYKAWEIKFQKLNRDVKKVFNNVSTSVEEFICKMNNVLDGLEEADKKKIENRIKGINMIKKMGINVMSNSLSRISQMETVHFENDKIISEISGKCEDEIRSIMNENYSSITNVSSEKSKLVNKYFAFIENSILPIIDGIDSGISFVENSPNEIIKRDILPQYIKLREIFDSFLEECGISKVDVKVHGNIDFSFVEVLDVEETSDINLDEKIESVIRNGYEYKEDIYGTGHNHVLRQAQIVAYKAAR